MQGMEKLLPKFFGDEGVLSRSYAEKLFEIPEKLERRKRRSVGGEYDDIDAQVRICPFW